MKLFAYYTLHAFKNQLKKLLKSWILVFIFVCAMIGLDPHAIKELKNTIEEMRAEGKTLLVSTHIIDSIDMLWDRTIIMQNGQIRANVTRAELEESGRTLQWELPYPGAKEMLAADVDDRELCCRMIRAMTEELPAPKAKR